MAEPLEELFSRYDRQEPQPAPAMSTGVRMKPPVQPQERNTPTIGPASDLDAALLKYGLKGDRPNPLMEMGGRGLAYTVGFLGDIAKAAHNQLFEPAESIPGDTEWMLRKLGAAGVTGQADISEQADLAANFIDPTTGVASFLTMPAHFGLIRKMREAQNSESTAAGILKLKKKAEGYNFTGTEEAMRGIEDFSELVRRNQELNTPFALKSEKRSATVANSFEKTPTLELNADCPLRSKYGATICAIEKRLARVRPNKPTLSSDELFNMSKALNKIKTENAPCLTCYVEAHRRSKADALQNYFNKSKPKLERTSQQLKQDVIKYLDKNEVPAELAFQQRVKADGEKAFRTNKEGQNVPQLEYFSEYMDRINELKETRPELAGDIDAMFAEAFRDRQPMRSKWVKSGAELPAEVRQKPADFVNDPIYGGLAKEAESYSQAVSMAKAPRATNAEYSGNFLRMSPKSVAAYMQTTKRGGDARGPRFSGSNDFVPDQLVDWFQALTDLSIRNMPAYTYTKDHRLAKIFGNSNMKINQSLAVRKNKDGQWAPDLVNGMPWEEALKNREKYPNVGNELTAKTDAQVLYGLDSDDIDIVIPGHYSGMSKKQIESMGWQNNAGELEKLRKKFGHHKNFSKIVNDVRSPETISPIQPVFDFDEAIKAYNEYLKSGGYPAMHEPNPDIIEEALKNVSEGRPAFASGGYVYDPEHIDDLVNQILKEN